MIKLLVGSQWRRFCCAVHCLWVRAGCPSIGLVSSATRCCDQWLLSPQIWNRSRAQLPSPSFGVRFPPISNSSFFFTLGFFPIYRESFVKGVDWKIGTVKKGRKFCCGKWKNRGSFVKGVVCPVKKGGSKNRGSFVRGADWNIGGSKRNKGEVLLRV